MILNKNLTDGQFQSIIMALVEARTLILRLFDPYDYEHNGLTATEVRRVCKNIERIVG